MKKCKGVEDDDGPCGISLYSILVVRKYDAVCCRELWSRHKRAGRTQNTKSKEVLKRCACRGGGTFGEWVLNTACGRGVVVQAKQQARAAFVFADDVLGVDGEEGRKLRDRKTIQNLTRS